MRKTLPSIDQTIGLILAGVGGGSVALLAGVVVHSGIDGGDVLSFSGGIVGSALAVWGAIYVEGRRRRRDDDAFSDLLTRMLRHLQHRLDQLLADHAFWARDGEKPGQVAGHMMMVFREMLTTLTLLERVNYVSQSRHFGFVAALIDLERWLRDNKPVFEKEATYLKDISWARAPVEDIITNRWWLLLQIGAQVDVALEMITGGKARRAPWMDGDIPKLPVGHPGKLEPVEYDEGGSIVVKNGAGLDDT